MSHAFAYGWPVVTYWAKLKVPLTARYKCLMSTHLLIFFWFVLTLLQRVCDHWRRKVRDYKTPCPENHNEPDRERDCHVPPSLWREDACIWSDSLLKQTDLLSPWQWRRSFAEGSRFAHNWLAALVVLLSVRAKAVAAKVWKANTGAEIVVVRRWPALTGNTEGWHNSSVRMNYIMCH